MPLSIIVERDKLLPALRRAARLIKSNMAIPILKNVRLTADGERVRVVGTNLDCQVETVVAAEVPGAGDITVPAERLFRVVNSLPDGAEIGLTEIDTSVTARSGRTRANLPTLPASDYAEMTPDDTAVGFVIPAASMRLGIDFCRDTICKTTDRPHFHGIRFECRGGMFSAYSFDGTNLSFVPLPVEEPPRSDLDFTLPTFAVDMIAEALPKEGNITVAAGSRLAAIQIDNLTIRTKLVDVEWQDWRRIIGPAPDWTLKVVPKAMLDSLGRAAAATDDSGVYVDIGFHKVSIFARGSVDAPGGTTAGINFADEVSGECNIEAATGALISKITSAIESLLRVNPDADEIEVCGFRDGKQGIRFYLPGRRDVIRISMPAVVRPPVAHEIHDEAA
jgi:DNA polymerase-3 subunit beta